MDTRTSARRAAGALLAILVSTTLLAGCASSPAPAEAGSEPGASDTAPAEERQSTEDCSGATTEGYELFLDPALTVETQADVYPLQSEADTIAFAYSGDLSAAPTFSWDLSYLQSDGTVAPVGGAPFFDEAGGAFSLSGPQSPVGVTGGPYPGFLDIIMTANARFDDATQSYTADTATIGRLCVMLAAG